MSVTITGDVHGKFDGFMAKVYDKSEHVIQIGDFGYNYEILNYTQPEKLNVVLGNHENYDDIERWPQLLKTYGLKTLGGLSFFYVRGAFSIDWNIRLIKYNTREWPKTWFENEELSVNELQLAIDEYKTVKPDIMITHDCPLSITRLVGSDSIMRNFGYDPDTFRTRTQMALQVMWETHQPKMHIFGHYHRDWRKTINGTEFICLNELSTINL